MNKWNKFHTAAYVKLKITSAEEALLASPYLDIRATTKFSTISAIRKNNATAVYASNRVK